jgi:hypothetical protein
LTTISLTVPKIPHPACKATTSMQHKANFNKDFSF